MINCMQTVGISLNLIGDHIREDVKMLLREPLHKIIRRERNVLIGFCVFTMILILIKRDGWVYAGILYGLHLVTMMFYYTRCKK